MRALALLAALALASCDAVSPGLVCTDEYVVLDVEVVDDIGRPIPGLTASSVNERTGETLGEVPTGYSDDPTVPGRYVLATDSDMPRLRLDGDPVRFTASGAGVTASATFTVANDGCHVRVEAGPDQVVAD